MGLEGKQSSYQKLRGVDTHQLVQRMQAHGIRVLGSSIIGLDDHTPDNIAAVIDHAVSHNTVFHQFMLYMPNPGTPLYETRRREGTLLPEAEFPPADGHGQYRFSYRHKNIKNGDEEQFLRSAFQKDFTLNGPSLARMIDVLLQGWQRYQFHPDKRVRKRFAREVFPLRSTYAGAVWAMKKWYRNNDRLAGKMDALLQDIYATFGLVTRVITPLIGRFAYWSLRKEEARLERGLTYEPACAYEKNAAALALESRHPLHVKLPVPKTTWESGSPAPVLESST
jgi:hypothetical protein